LPQWLEFRSSYGFFYFYTKGFEIIATHFFME
jgi:hypothetical protein